MIPIRVMNAADLTVGKRLSRQAGWNQSKEDWYRLLDLQPEGCFVAERDGKPIGTVTTCIFGSVAWIAMVLVEESLRSQGIGKSLMVHALDFLDQQGVETIRLDATSLGLPLYEKLGFVTEYRLDRYHGHLPGAEMQLKAQSITLDQLDDIIAFDRVVTATNRCKLLRRLATEHPESLRVTQGGQGIEGFLMARPGVTAMQIGPCIAGPETGVALLNEAWQTYSGRYIYIDIPSDHLEAQSLAQSAGLTVQRSLVRMSRGMQIVEQRSNLWASAGPEKG